MQLAAGAGEGGCLMGLVFTGGAACLTDTDHKGLSPLTAAARGGHTSVCELLLGMAVVDPAQEDHQGWTALHHAASQGHGDVCELLVDRGAPIWTSKKRLSALHLAAKKGHQHVLEKLLRVVSTEHLIAAIAAVGESRKDCCAAAGEATALD